MAEPDIASTVVPASTTAAPAAVAAPVDAVEHPQNVPTLLESIVAPGKEEPTAEADKPKTDVVADKPVDAKAAPDVKDAVVESPKALEPVEYKYEVPETLNMTDEYRGEFHTALDAFRQDHNPQSLIALHEKAMKQYGETVAQSQWKSFNDTRLEWRKEIMADPEIGGAGHATAMSAAARMRDQFISGHQPGSKGYQSDVEEFNNFLRVTGAGDHPVFNKFLHRMAQTFDEPAMPPPDARPAQNGGKPRAGRVRDIYKSNGNGQ